MQQESEVETDAVILNLRRQEAGEGKHPGSVGGRKDKTGEIKT